MSTHTASTAPWRYQIGHFGIPNDFDYLNYDLHPEYVTEFLNKLAHDLSRAEEELQNVIGDLSQLKEWRECDYPL